MATWWSRQLGRSLRLRLTATLSLGLGLLLSVLFVALDVTADRALYAEFDNSLHRQAHAVLAVLRSSSPAAIGDPGSGLLPEFRRDVRSDFFQIWDADGHTITKSDSCAEQDLQRPPAFDGDGPEYFEPVLPNGVGGRAAAIHAELPGLPAQFRQPITLVVAEEAQTLEVLEERAHYLLFGALLLTVLLSSLLANFAVRRGLVPLHQVGERAIALSSRPYHPLSEEPSASMSLPVELVPLANSLDAALAALLATVERERRFARTVAHELRTPLAALRAGAEWAQRLHSLPEVQHELSGLIATTDEMARSLDGLLALARYEAGLAHAEPEPLDLHGLLLRLVAQLAPRALERDLSWRVNVPETLWVSSHPDLLARVLSNLLSNAIDYAPAGDTIDLWTVAQDERIAVHVGNEAPQLRPALLDRFGQSHWRQDPQIEPERHGGLGLPLAGSIAAVLDLRLAFRLDGQRLIASVYDLPCVVVATAP